MKISEIRELKTAELHAELEHLRRHLFDLRAQAVTEKLENPFRITAGKRDIARILTVLRERGERPTASGLTTRYAQPLAI